MSINYNKITTLLSEYKPISIEIYINYLKFLENEKDKEGKQKNKWFPYFTDEQAAEVFKKVARDNVYIDGETITISYRGKIIVSYNYQAYKNIVLNIYPETTFDIQLVYDGDDFSFFKESGRVVYSHRIKNPFETNKKIIGTYCIIKNNRGEFLETLSMDDVAKMKAVATTKNIWNEWESEMVLKSVIKRSCKRHFKDIVVNVEKLDNDNYELDNVTVDNILQTKIENTNSISELSAIYKENINSVPDKVSFTRILGERKAELIELLPPYDESCEAKAIELLKKHGKFDALLTKWKFTEEQKETLLSKAI